jgi:hypothetical protein
MPTPETLAQLLVLVEQAQGQFAFQVAHDFGHGIFRRNGQHHMDMIRLNVEFEYLHVLFPSAQFMDFLLGIGRYIVFEDSVAVLGTEHDVILALI